MSKKILLMIIGSIVLVFTTTITVIFVNNSKNIKKFEITFDTNGGTIVEKQIVKKGEKVIKPEDPVKDGYGFIEWTYEDKTYDFNSGVTQNLILVAKYQEINEDIETFVVKFDSDGGTTISNQIIEKGNIIEKPEDPTKEGYTFVGWFLNDEIYDFSTILEKDIELKAKWEEIKQTNNKQNVETNNKLNNNSSNDKTNSSNNTNDTEPEISPKPSESEKPVVKKYTVTFNTNGGNSISSQTIKEGEIATKPTNPTRKGYTFTGWTLNGTNYDFSTPVRTDLLLIASWENNIWEVSQSGSIIKYNGNDKNVEIPSTIDGISINSISSNAFSSLNMETLTLASTINSIEINAFTKSNNSQMQKVFVTESQVNNISNWLKIFGTNQMCWEKSNTGTFVMSKMGGSCNTWTYSLENKDEHYFIGFALGTCPNTGGNSNYYLSKEDTPLFNIDAVGYEFEGWTGTDLITVTKNVIISKGSAGDRGYTAHCREYVWYINLDYSNYSGLDFSNVDYSKEPYCGTSSSKCKYKYSQTVTIPENQVINNGYTFVGWSTTRNGNVVYKPGEKVSKLFKTDNATLTLYPVWK